jgi:tRNA 2-selenouridine synthase
MVMNSAPSLPIEAFLELSKTQPIFDVRTPSEFAHAHIPHARNLALFSDEERAIIGTAYKQESREKAIMHGFEFFGPKMKTIVEQALANTTGTDVLVHCWRGGMRSSAVAWLLNFYGLKTHLLEGGYKAFRRYALNSFEIPKPLIILGGKTGSGKTHILHEIHKLGAQTIDLEGIACHKGSAFGALGMPAQPSQEQFENILGVAYREITPERPLWLEDESRKIGMAMIPEQLFKSMRSAKTIFIDMPLGLRVEGLVKDYGAADREGLRASILKIKDQLGGDRTKKAIAELEAERLAECFEILLSYYDKTYLHGIEKREPSTVFRIEVSTMNASENARNIVEFAEII